MCFPRFDGIMTFMSGFVQVDRAVHLTGATVDFFPTVFLSVDFLKFENVRSKIKWTTLFSGAFFY